MIIEYDIRKVDTMNRTTMPRMLCRIINIKDQDGFNISMDNNYINIEKYNDHHKNSQFNRKIDKLNRIVIPKSFLTYFNINPGDSVKIFHDVPNKIIKINKYIYGCIICNSIENITEIENLREKNETFICEKCMNAIKKQGGF